MEVCPGFELIAIENAAALGHDLLELSKRPEAQMIRHMRHGSPPRLMALQPILSPNRRESLPTPSARDRMRRTFPYWYAYHPRWDEYLEGARQGLLVLGCTDFNYGFAIPQRIINSVLGGINTTTRPNGETYWHLHLLDTEGEYCLLLPKTSGSLSLSPYVLRLHS